MLSTPEPPLGEEELARTEELLEEWFAPDAPARWHIRRLIAALRAKDEELERLRELADAARLLGPARIVLDRCAMNGGDQERQDAGDMAQRIVDLIGHRVTDELPHALVELDELREEVKRLRERIQFLEAAFKSEGYTLED